MFPYMVLPLQIRSLVAASDLARKRKQTERRWCLSALGGRLVELSGQADTAVLTVSLSLVREAQEKGEPAAWVTGRGSSFFPPDALDLGVCLDALPVVRAASARDLCRAADGLLRSGAFGLVVLDLASVPEAPALPHPLLGRLGGLVQKHDAALVFLTQKSRDAPSLGSLVSLRAEVVRRRKDSAWRTEVRVLKDKQNGPGWRHEEELRGALGMR